MRPYVSEQLEFRKLDKISVKGKSIGCVIYELLGRKKDLPPIATILNEDTSEIAKDQRPLPLANEAMLQMRSCYDTALKNYFMGNFNEAALQFEECLKLIPNDGPATTMLTRSQYFSIHRPSNWDGVYHNVEK